MSLFSFLPLGKSSSKGYSSAAMPDFPDLVGSDGLIKSQYQLQNPESFNTAENAFNALYNYSTSEGPSSQANYLLEANENNYQNALDQTLAQNSSSTQDSLNRLAMRGGATRGNMSRAYQNLANMNMGANQSAAINKANSDLNVLQADESQKLNTLSTIPSQGVQLGTAQNSIDQYNIGNSLDSIYNKYNAEAKGIAANNAANQYQWTALNTGGLLGNGGLLGSGFRF